MDNRKAVLIRLDNNQPYYLDDSMYTIGRSDSCSIVIKDPTLSREHARIWWDNGNWYLEDTDSANGVELNGVLLEPGRPYILPLGCTILLAATYEFRFGWGAEFDNRTISVPSPEQYASGPRDYGRSSSSGGPQQSSVDSMENKDSISPDEPKKIEWNNSMLRKNGKADFKRIGSAAIWAALVYFIIIGIPSAISSWYVHMNATYYGDYVPTFLILMGIYLLILIFVLNPLLVGIRRFFYKRIRNDLPLGEITWGFRNNYKGIVQTMFIRDVILFLWMLIFIIGYTILLSVSLNNDALSGLMWLTPLLLIPFWIQNYAYRMVPYILGKNPDITGIRVLKLSNMMTKGFKGRMFSLDFSFIGWFILTGFTLGIAGFFYVNPYKCCTDAEVFNLLLD